MDRYTLLLGCLWGTALGDAVGLKREGLSRRRAEKLYGKQSIEPNLVFGLGWCSDDTEHTQMVGRALVQSGGDASKFQRALAGQLRIWLLCIPAGIGLATLKACLRLLFGMHPSNSGVFSAGNGPAMRSALIGVWAESEEQMRSFVRCCTRITHSDPKAEEAALLVAKAASLKSRGIEEDAIEFLSRSAEGVEGTELRDLLRAAVRGLGAGNTPTEFADHQGWSKGVNGYINHSVIAALYCWAFSPTDFRQCIENAVSMGGDTDSNAAIAGAICGANIGSNELPSEWTKRMAEWPRNIRWMERLADSLNGNVSQSEPTQPPRMHWPATLIRNIGFAAIVLALGVRRLMPPY